MYKTGTLVLYYWRGVYKVEGVEAPPLQEDDGRVYYKLCPAFPGYTEMIYIPVDAVNVMRTLISREEALDYLMRYPKLKPKVLHSGKMTDLIKHYREMLASQKVEDCLLMIKELYIKQRDLADYGKKPGQVDLQYSKIAQRLICEEFAVALDTTPDAIRERLYADIQRRATA